MCLQTSLQNTGCVVGMGSVGVTHLGCDDHTALITISGFARRMPGPQNADRANFPGLHRSYILGNTVCDCRVDGVFGNISFYTELSFP